MPRMFSLSALNERLAMAIAVGLSARISRHHASTSASSCVGRHDLVDEPHLERLGGGVAAAQKPDLARPLLADEARQIGGAPARIDRADARADLAEHRVLRGDRQIAHGRQHVAAADRIALHLGDDRLAAYRGSRCAIPRSACRRGRARRSRRPADELSPPAQKARVTRPGEHDDADLVVVVGVARTRRASPRPSWPGTRSAPRGG